MGKSQTSTEYLIILAVVILIALIVIGVLGGIPSIGGGAKEQALQATWKTKTPIAISKWAAGDDFTVIELKNTGTDILEIETIVVDDLTIDINQYLTIGQKYKFKLPGKFEITQTSFSFNYSVGYASYVGKSELSQNYSEGSSLTKGLIAYWKFDRDFKDYTSNSFDLSSSGAGNDAKIVDSALYLDGDLDFVSTGTVSHNITGDSTNSFTISAWFNNHDCTSSDYGGIGLSNQNTPRILARPTNYIFQLTGGGSYSIFSSCVEDKWIHYAGTYSQDSFMMSLYIDGALEDSDSANVWNSYLGRDGYNTSGFVEKFSIGRSHLYFNGSIDEVMIFNRELSADEVESLYKAGR